MWCFAYVKGSYSPFSYFHDRNEKQGVHCTSIHTLAMLQNTLNWIALQSIDLEILVINWFGHVRSFKTKLGIESKNEAVVIYVVNLKWHGNNEQANHEYSLYLTVVATMKGKIKAKGEKGSAWLFCWSIGPINKIVKVLRWP